MAERTTLQILPARSGARPEIPWDEWLDGSVWRLTAGEDFTNERANFRNQIYAAARKRGLKAVCRAEGPDLLIQALPS